MLKLNLLGSVNNRGHVEVDENKTVFEILKEHGKGIIDSKKIGIVQVGGPLGKIIYGKELDTPLKDLLNDMDAMSLLFLDEMFCPVDYGRFAIRYVIRELGFNNEHIDTLNNLIEEISSGRTRRYTLEDFQREIQLTSNNPIEKRLNNVIKTLYYKFENTFIEHINNKKCTHGICHRLAIAQCVNACPAEVNIPGYVALMYDGQTEEAYRLMKQTNPLLLVCGKICARPCEMRCRRGEIENTVGVRAIKHYVAETTIGQKDFIEDKLSLNGKNIGIVGSGPAGLSAAYYLARSGYAVEIYEKHPVVGGMLALGVPSYRLSQESIDKEVETIKALGVKISTNTEIGKNIIFADLEKKHDGIILATGTHKANIFSGHLANVTAAIDFLRDVKLNGRRNIGEIVVVIGGGDVAFDAARTAIRLGAKAVKIVSLESLLQMPASNEEVEGAKKEGIEIINGYGTKIIKDQNNLANEIIFKRCLDVYDMENRFAPIYDEEDTLNINCDEIILAIGQKADTEYLADTVMIEREKNLQFRTSKDNIYIAGDMIRPGTAIKAIAEGKKAAALLHKEFSGKELYIGEKVEIPTPQTPCTIWDLPKNIEKTAFYTENTKDPFAENVSTFSREIAMAEALRCMRCDRNSKQ